MKSWIKYGLAGALILVASFWGGSVRAAEVQLTQDGAVVPGQINTGVAPIPQRILAVFLDAFYSGSRGLSEMPMTL